MDIREYMFKHRLTALQMAELIGCSKQHIAYMKKSGRASKWLAIQIERVTNGEIKAASLYGQKTDEAA